VVMRRIIMELQFLQCEVVPLNSQIMDHTSKEELGHRDEDQVQLLLHQFKDRLDLLPCVLLPSLHLHHQSQTHLEVGVRVIIRLPHHRHQCNLSQSKVSSIIVIPLRFRQRERIHYLLVKEVMNTQAILDHLRLGFLLCSRLHNFYHLQNHSLRRQKLIQAGIPDRWSIVEEII